MSMRSIYRKIAKEHGVSVTEVKKDMQAAINYAYNNPDKSAGEKVKQRIIPCKGEIITTEEFIKYAVQKIKKEQK